LGRAAGSARVDGGTPGAAALAKKALSIRPRNAQGADARAAPGQLNNGQSGASRNGVNGRIDWFATLLKGKPAQRRDVVLRPRSARPTECWLVIVDASASTRRHGALAKAKGLLSEVFEQARQQRVRLALLKAGGAEAGWVWPGRKASQAQKDWLAELGAGGGTPLLDALQQASTWAMRRQRLRPAEQLRLLIVTDGRLRDWLPLGPSICPSMLVDIESAPVRLGRAQKLADELGATYCHIDNLRLLEQPDPRSETA
jgi:magnesium chelatase subunit ChlD-like protein